MTIEIEECKLCRTGVKYTNPDGSTFGFKPHTPEFCHAAALHRVSLLERVAKDANTQAGIANHRAMLSAGALDECEDWLEASKRRVSELEAKLAVSEERAETWKHAGNVHLRAVQKMWDDSRVWCTDSCDSFDGVQTNMADCNCGVADLVNGNVFKAVKEKEAGRD